MVSADQTTRQALEQIADARPTKGVPIKDTLEGCNELARQALAVLAVPAPADMLTEALREIAEYEEPWPQDPSDVYEHFQAVARAALASVREPAEQDGEL